jgi:predicted ATPase
MIHQDTSIHLLPLTVFVGPNGGGKSAFFDALLNFSMLSRGNLRQAFGPYPYSFRATLYRGANPNLARIGYTASMSRTPNDPVWLDYRIDYAMSGMDEDQPRFTVFTEQLSKQPGNTVLFDRSDPDSFPLSKHLELENDRAMFSAIRQRQMSGEVSNIDELVLYCAQQISKFNRFRLDPYVLAQPTRLPDLPGESVGTAIPRIGYHGEDLAATLYYLSETKAPELGTIRTLLKEIDSEFEDFEFNNVGTDRIAFSLTYSDPRKSVPSVRLSSGILTYLGLVALVSTPSRPPVLMIEEPENGLTPQAVKSFYRAVRSLAHPENTPYRSQVMISSHSPFVICEAWNGEDRDFIFQMKIAGGRSQARKFSEVIAAHHIQVAKDDEGKRTILSLKNAEEIMSGYLS